jgi:asparagine synthase (glutamine-hydrolysing)
VANGVDAAPGDTTHHRPDRLGLPRKHVLVISHAGPAVPPDLVVAAGDAFAYLTLPVDHVVLPGLHVFISGTGPEDMIDPPSGRLLLSLSLGARRVDGRRLQWEELLALLTDGPRGAAAVCAPFAAIGRADTERPVRAATDDFGLRHLFFRSGAGWAAVSTAGSLLARLRGDVLDQEAVGFYSLAGCYPHDRTPWSAVRRLSRGSVVSLAEGRLTLETTAEHAVPAGRTDSFADAVEQGRQVISEVVRDALGDRDRVTLELSGGLDSRMLLAAVPSRDRARLKAITLGSPGEPDLEVAVAVAHQLGIAHQVVPRGTDGLDEATCLELVDTGARRVDFSANPLATAALVAAERSLGQGPRLTGQNGEFSRGFYYGAQPDLAWTPTVLARALARWRVFANDRIDPTVLRADVRKDIQDVATAQVVGELRAAGTDWLSATDELYLRLRMQSWVGADFSAASLDRELLAPFFDPRFVAWARSCRPRHKRASRLFAAVLTSLDPVLADVPLASGGTPRELATGGVKGAASRTTTAGSKIVRKVGQQMRRTDRPAVGAAVLAAGVRSAWASGRRDPSSLLSCDLLDHVVVEDIVVGRRAASTATTGLLVDLDGAIAACGAVEGKSPS